jgi:hypothetical protein
MLVKGKKYRGKENDEKDKLSEKEEERRRVGAEEKEKEEVKEDGKRETVRK